MKPQPCKHCGTSLEACIKSLCCARCRDAAGAMGLKIAHKNPRRSYRKKTR